MINRDKLFMDGQWVEPSGSKTIEVRSASTEKVIGLVPQGSPQDADRAVRAARAAFDGWAQTPTAERAVFLAKIHEGLKARQADIARMIATEVGMPIKLATRIQAGSPIYIFKMYADMIAAEQLESHAGNSLLLREPVGVIAAITPWNYPLHQIAAKVAPALAAGCTVVLKPSEVAPLNAFMLADVISESGLPAGVFNLVSGFGGEVGEALVRHPEVEMISFTGSTRAGMRISELAGAGIKRVALELGGKSASIVLDDADLASAVKGTVNSCFLNSGQTCSAHTRLLVPEKMYDEVAAFARKAAEEFAAGMGDPLLETTKLGPLISGAQRDRVRRYIQTAIDEGAELIAGGLESVDGLAAGYYVRPTVFGRVDPKSTLGQEEVFGPVLAIMTYKTEDDAVRIANGTPYGLAGAVWSGNVPHALGIARRLRTGQVDINGAAFNYQAPFGGFKKSGFGREFGRAGLDEFLEYKAIQLPAQK